MGDRDEALEALELIARGTDHKYPMEHVKIRQALERQRVPDIKAAAQRMAEYLAARNADFSLHFSVPRDGDLSDCTVDGEVDLHELAQAALAAAPEDK